MTETPFPPPPHHTPPGRGGSADWLQEPARPIAKTWPQRPGGQGHSPTPVQAAVGWCLRRGSNVWMKAMRSEVWVTLSVSSALGLGFTHDE